ncbi:hypothetical protein GQ43DRAFT_388852 [Delitschia confertaspora ATCC 74209]|uniref:Early meiotic induction protein 1 n=1 Tax=Delitschia confertaspora ATCC 74209 TaxID=1513339 RepID=A0A9P4JV38_9PLEO|nr:hypothetical protein GQ43DRAFT_388852 [Delitschia confertaspora ATCC 74209]
MGWLWSSSTDSNAPTYRSSPQCSNPSAPAAAPAPPTPIATEQENLPPTEAQNTAAFNAAFPHLAPSTPSSLSQSTQPPQSEYPDTMSCRQAFDSAFYCRSLGGAFNDIYRYGELKSCSDHWSDFWFCMRNKSKAESVKRELIIERYKEKEAKIRGGPNSEDVWRARRPNERLRNAFQEPLDEE